MVSYFNLRNYFISIERSIGIFVLIEVKWMYIIVFLSGWCYGQTDNILVIGNSDNLCFPGDSTAFLQFADSLPENLSSFDAVFLFSKAGNGFRTEEIDSLILFVENGGGIYLGADNAPLQTESNQLTDRIYSKSYYGNYYAENAESSTNGKLKLNELDSIPAGTSTVAFPLDYRLTVEAWIEDQPLILSGELKKGKVIIDGGYSRFYCSSASNISIQLFTRIITFLVSE